LFIKNLAKILGEGAEINDLLLKDLDYFEKLFSYNSFPELLEALQGKQQIVEVYGSKIPVEGTSFPSKTPFLSKTLIKERIGEPYGDGMKQTVYLRKVQLDFLFERGVIADFCSLLD